MSDTQSDSLCPIAEAEKPMSYICCAARHTYGIGAVPAGLNEDAPGAATIDPQTKGIHVVSELFRTARYHWRFPADGFINPTPFTEQLGQFYASLATRNCPASVLVRLEGAVLADSILYANVPVEPTIVYETFRPNDRPAVHTISRDAIRTADPNRFADPTWQNLFIGSAGSSNYGHWLVDDLPRLEAVEALVRADPRPVRVLIHSYGAAIDQIRMQSIRLLFGPSIHIDLLDPATPYFFRELFYATPVSEHPLQKSPVAIDHLVRETVSRARAVQQAGSTPAMVFVDRSTEHGRTLSNKADIRALVERFGFTTVTPERMSFTEQVQLFTGAQIVIGEMGAAMTNTVFCRPTTTVIYLAPAGWIEPFYWDLSVVRGHHYRVLYGEVTDPAVPPHRSDFTIDPGALEQAINAL